jgi:hypothetical protein
MDEGPAAHIQLLDEADAISCRFTPNGEYSVRSAYATQFAGSFADYEWTKLWQAKAENKCKIFSWLILQNKVWTENDGTTNPVCKL